MTNPRLLPGALIPGCALSIALLALPCRAATYTVTTTADSLASPPPSSLRAAIAAADATSEADKIVFNLPLEEQVGGKWQISLLDAVNPRTSVTIAGPGADKLTITRAGSTPIIGIAYYGPITSTPTLALSISGIRFSQLAPAIYPAYSRLEVNNCVFDSNTSAISGFDYALKVTNGTFMNNSSASDGGAVYSKCPGFNADFTNCVFTGNQGRLGGAIYSEAQDLTFTGCRFEGNKATKGGAIFNAASNPMTSSDPPSIAENRSVIVDRSVFTNNSAFDEGGAIDVTVKTTAFKNCYFEKNNLATSTVNPTLGGAIMLPLVGSSSIEGCTFTGNYAQHGTTVAAAGGDMKVVNSTFYRNASSSETIFRTRSSNANPGAIEGSMAVTNCTFAENSTSTEGAELLAFYMPVTVQNTLFKITTGGGFGVLGATGTSLGNNITTLGKIFASSTGGNSTDKLNTDPQLDGARLLDNGGLVPTIALRPGSPALNKGNDAVLSAPLSLVYDARGPGFARKRGAHVDIGAFESGGTPTANEQRLTTDEDTSLAITLSGAATAGGALTYKVTVPPYNGTLSTLNGNQLTYTPRANYYGTDVFYFAVEEGNLYSASVPIYLTVNSVPDAPSAKVLATWQGDPIPDMDGKYLTNRPIGIKAQFSDGDGFADMQYAAILVGNNQLESNAISIRYSFADNTLSLRDNTGTDWVGAVNAYQTGVLTNSQGKLLCGYGELNFSGSTLTLTAYFIPFDGFSGAHQIWARATDSSTQSAWSAPLSMSLNAWGNLKPVVQDVYHSDYYGPDGSYPAGQQPVNFACSFADDNGITDLKSYSFTIGATTIQGQGLTLRYDVQTNLLYMLADDGKTWLGGYAPRSERILENSRGYIDMRDVWISLSPTHATLNFGLIPTTAFAGSYHIWAEAKDMANKTSGVQDKGPITFTATSAGLNGPAGSGAGF